MRYSKSSLLAIALTVAFSTVEFSSVAYAQSNKDFPWRSKTNRKAAAEAVKSSFAKPKRDLTTIETIATPTPSFESMPSVIYDEGKKYVRQGDTYVESPSVTAATAARGGFTTSNSNHASPLPAVTQIPMVKKSSLFQKTKDLTGRLNPFSKSLRSPNAYGASDWKIPSFSNTLSSFSKKDDDPITFASVTPLPAKTSVPASLDSVQPMLGSNEPYEPPALALPVRDSQFKSALPTKTKLTPVFPTDTSVTSVFSAESESILALPLEPKTITSGVGKGNSGFTANASNMAGVLPKTSPSRDVSVFQATTTKRPVRTSSLSADNEFWSPQR